MTANRTIQLHSDSPEQTRGIAAGLAKNLCAGDVIALEGELGAGKTCFVRGLAQGLDIDPAQVASPTFVIAHEYESAGAGAERRLTLVHVDAYRLRRADDLDAIGWSEIIERRDAIIALEWPSRVLTALPSDRIDVRIEHVGELSRTISIATTAALVDRLGQLTDDASGAAAGGTAKCRTCGRMFDRAATATFPFCSSRCRLADLGQWFREGYRTSRAVEQDDELSE